MPRPVREVVYRPARPARQHGPDWDRMNPYLVTQGAELLFAYYPCYYDAGEVVADMIARFEADQDSLTGEWASMDFAVWCDNRIMAVVHRRFDDEEGRFHVVRMTEDGNDPGAWPDPIYGWPTRDEWIAAGRPDRIELTQEDLERNIARANEGKDIRTISLDDFVDPEAEDDGD